MSGGRRAARASSFGAAAADYQRCRPEYPLEAASLLIGDLGPDSRVLDLGAGTGKLTDQLLRLGVQVSAVDPSPEMLAELSSRHPEMDCLVGTAEAIPLPEGSVDAAVVGQAWHWMDAATAGRELRRVISGPGTLGLAWNIDHTETGWLNLIDQVCDLPRGSELGRSTGRVPAHPGPDWLPFSHHEVDWTMTLSKEDFLSLWQTHSQWLTAGEQDRTRWMARWRQILSTDPQVATLSTVEIPMTTECWVTRLRDHR